MKKIFTLSSLIFCASISAQIISPINEGLINNSSTVNERKLSTNIFLNSLTVDNYAIKTFTTSVNSHKMFGTRADEEIRALYEAPIGSLYSGISRLGIYKASLVNVPVLKEFTFINYSSEGTYEWSLDKIESSVNADGDFTIKGAFGSSDTPVLTVTNNGSSASYYLGQGNSVKAGGIFYGNDVMPLSFADPAMGLYDGINLVNGSKLQFSTGENFYDTGKKTTGFRLAYPDLLGNLYARGMYMMLAPKDPSKPIIPQGETLNLTVREVKGDNTVTVATATATADNLVAFGDGTSGLYLLRFQFATVDEDGFETLSPVVFNNNAMLIADFTGFENANAVMTFGGAQGFVGNSYVILEDGNISTLGYGNDPESPQINFHVGFDNATFTFAQLAESTSTVTFPKEGGYGITQTIDGQNYNDIQIATPITDKDEDENFNYTVVSLPDWVSGIEYDTQYLAEQSILIFYCAATELPADEKGREGIIKIDICGSPISIKAIQGEGGVGIANTKVSTMNAICDGENIQLTYPTEINTVSIINVAGQVLATYELPTSGKYTIPAADLNKGIYLLKFNNNQTIKVIK